MHLFNARIVFFLDLYWISVGGSESIPGISNIFSWTSKLQLVCDEHQQSTINFMYYSALRWSCITVRSWVNSRRIFSPSPSPATSTWSVTLETSAASSGQRPLTQRSYPACRGFSLFNYYFFPSQWGVWCREDGEHQADPAVPDSNQRSALYAGDREPDTGVQPNFRRYYIIFSHFT